MEKIDHTVNKVEVKDKGIKISEPLTVWRGTTVQCEFDGKNWTQEYQDEKTGEWDNIAAGEYTLDELADEFAESIADGRQRHLQSDVDPSSGRSVQFANEDTDQAKLFRSMVDKKLKELGSGPYFAEK